MAQPRWDCLATAPPSPCSSVQSSAFPYKVPTAVRMGPKRKGLELVHPAAEWQRGEQSWLGLQLAVLPVTPVEVGAVVLVL